MSHTEAYIVAATRLPVGKRNGMYATTRPDDMLAAALQGALAQVPSLDPALIEDVIAGCAMPEAEQGMNVARMSLLLAGLPQSVAGVTVNRFCASGLQAVADAAARIRNGEADVMIGAGTESMSAMPQIMGNKIALNPRIFAQAETLGMAYGMGLTGEKVAERWNVSRADQDAFALASHQKACAAIAAGHFRAEITPYTIIKHLPDGRSGVARATEQLVDTDEGPRPDTSLEALARLKPVFAARGSVTAGNSSQMSDGAGAVILVSERMLKQFQLQPLARFLSFSVAGVSPEIMGIGPIAAVPKALARAGLTLDDIGWIELNEAFAAQSLAVIRDLGLDPARVNPLGGAIALGHPLGATGALRTATLLHGLRRTGTRYGMVTMCIGTGMGAAGIFEAL
ncbi:acetyl-CoA C-acyltransferase [Bordetella holmesii]|uniref:acetyl-CoA C-acyltransferase n=2 Tax=Bordetella holmesii TaxID=35814 RepID=A0A158M1K9_9BORD|nr:acetyl-CoA C-acyltransferase [Bordetella holmesii]AHV93487.1 acetyl-CoA C-acetyltransferase family protein [Bordetella holmesii ATCC 51541]AIT27443.1 acetyl-CoA C-acetyltransferase family protein [Bordetella holmesii 44057]EWM43748.1 acetyl-CoA C-acetyltransferase family protein [Bordetella holmesii 41130]EWM48034.1 acetyl-CoA C-acetyltransferase family protein [Bordetella holmesii 35009]EWM49015.1 acetyl-CoA C-acetyltransferase family protein [Bordetella holmesii 70147]